MDGKSASWPTSPLSLRPFTARLGYRMAAPADRYACSKAILGEDLFNKVQNSRVLVVGSVSLSFRVSLSSTRFKSRANSYLYRPAELEELDASSSRTWVSSCSRCNITRADCLWLPTPSRSPTVMTGFGGSPTGAIEVLDLDTIDLSNLNRQFLFQKQHVKRPKAVVSLSHSLAKRVADQYEHAQVARETALKFNPHVNITAHHRNIKVSSRLSLFLTSLAASHARNDLHHRTPSSLSTISSRLILS